MSLEITRHQTDGIEIVTLSGRLAMGAEDLTLRNELDLLVSSGKTQVIFNISHLSVQDVDGLGSLLEGITRLKDIGGHVAVSCTSLQKLNLQEVIQLESAMKVFETAEDAIESFFPEQDHHYDVLQFVEAYGRQHPKPNDGQTAEVSHASQSLE